MLTREENNFSPEWDLERLREKCCGVIGIRSHLFMN